MTMTDERIGSPTGTVRAGLAIARRAAVRGVLAVTGTCVGAGCAGDDPGQAHVSADTQNAVLADGEQAAGRAFTHYVAMGDSFSAGTGLADQAGACTSSQGSWPYQVRDQVNVGRVASATGAAGSGVPTTAAPPEMLFKACSGAQMENITGPYPKRGQGPQIEALTRGSLPNTTLITLTISGNDAGTEAFAECLQVAANTPGMQAEATCEEIAKNITKRIDTVVAPLLKDTFLSLKNAAPSGATIVAVGYPHTLSTSNNELCKAAGFATSVPTTVRTLFNTGIDRLNKAIRDAAKSAGILSITNEVVAEFRGHELCSEEEFFVGLGDPLLFTPTGKLSEAAGHPNVAGYEAYARAVLSVLTARARIATVANTPDAGPPITSSAAPLPGATPLPSSTSGTKPTAGTKPDGGVTPASGTSRLPGSGAQPAKPAKGAGDGGAGAQSGGAEDATEEQAKGEEEQQPEGEAEAQPESGDGEQGEGEGEQGAGQEGEQACAAEGYDGECERGQDEEPTGDEGEQIGDEGEPAGDEGELEGYEGEQGCVDCDAEEVDLGGEE